MTDEKSGKEILKEQIEKYPEHQKLEAYMVKRDHIQEFYDWLTIEEEYVIAKYHIHSGCSKYGGDGTEACGMDEETLYSIHMRPERLFGNFLGIDPDKLSREKDAMLEEIRRANDARTNRD